MRDGICDESILGREFGGSEVIVTFREPADQKGVAIERAYGEKSGKVSRGGTERGVLAFQIDSRMRRRCRTKWPRLLFMQCAPKSAEA